MSRDDSIYSVFGVVLIFQRDIYLTKMDEFFDIVGMNHIPHQRIWHCGNLIGDSKCQALKTNDPNIPQITDNCRYCDYILTVACSCNINHSNICNGRGTACPYKEKFSER